jgi:hypothetical protein
MKFFKRGGKKMRKIVVFTVIVISIILLGNLAIAEEFEGWEEIRPVLKDGDGSEFIVDIDYGLEFTEATEFDQVLAAANWVAFHMVYEYDPDPPGDVWTTSDQQFCKRQVEMHLARKTILHLLERTNGLILLFFLNSK